MSKTKEEIINIVKIELENSGNNLSVEYSKLDFKRDWYNLKSDQGIQEFLKDTVAMVNTVGLDGIIVIGFDDKTKKFHECNFYDSKLNDPSELLGIISKNISYPFSIDAYDISSINGKRISIIHLPPSFEKPHVLKSFRTYKGGDLNREELQRILVRKGSKRDFATKSDLELMLYDRKNIEPDYRIFLSTTRLDKIEPHNKCVKFTCDLSIENSGKRPMAISQIELKLQYYNEDWEEYIFSSYQVVQPNLLGKDILENPLIVLANSIIQETISFLSAPINHDDIIKAKIDRIQRERANFKSINAQIFLINGVALSKDLLFVRKRHNRSI
ncbi:MAG: ATP-binding protein [Bacteroidia bacterium]